MSFVLLNWQEKNSKADPAVQNTSTRDAEHSPAKEIPSTLQRKSSGNSISQFQPSSPKKTDGFMPPSNSIMRRRRSSEGLGTDESFTGTRVVTFSSKGEHVVHCGKCLGKFIGVCFLDHSLLPYPPGGRLLWVCGVGSDCPNMCTARGISMGFWARRQHTRANK